jgi:hypothetical protein
MALAVEIKRDLNLTFSIEEVKNAIDLACSKSKAYYQIKDKNDIMNTYTIWLLGGMMVQVPISLQLKKISENETQITLNTTKLTNNANQSNDIIDKFLNVVSKVLAGEDVTEETVAKAKGGCFGMMVALLGVGYLLYFLI